MTKSDGDQTGCAIYCRPERPEFESYGCVTSVLAVLKGGTVGG